MRTALFSMALVVAAFMLGLPSLLIPRAPEYATDPNLFPAFLAPPSANKMPTFSDVRASIDSRGALRASDRCIDAAFAAEEGRRPGNKQRVLMEAYLGCYVDRLEHTPHDLCNKDKRGALARYTRGYFQLLAQEKEIASHPETQGFLEIERKLHSGQDIRAGFADGSPNPRIIEGLERLADIGAFAEGERFEDLLQPDVPDAIIQKLASITPVHPLCP